MLDHHNPSSAAGTVVGGRGRRGPRPTRHRALLAAVAGAWALTLHGCGFLDGGSSSPATAGADAAVAETAGAAETAATAAGAPGTVETEVRAGATPTVSRGGTTTGTSTPAAATTGAINSIDTIVNDMKLNNDVVLAGVPSSRGYAAGPGHVIMGNDPRGSRTPNWWNPANSYYKSGAYWNHITPWMVIFDGVGNAASNTRVEMRNMKAYYKSRSTGQWVLLSQGAVDGSNYPKTLIGSNVTPPDIRSVGGGVVSVRPPNGDSVFHGWCCARTLPAPADIAAIHITLQARLTVHDASRPDDRAAARYLVQVGGDYYPDGGTNINAFAPDYFNPGIGLSRSKLVGNAWQSYSFTTINVGVQDPGGASISEAELRRAPPPLD